MKSRLFRFLIVGSIAAAIQYVILVILVEFFSADPVASSAVGFVLSAFVNYILNYIYTFRSTLPHSAAFPKFFATALVGLLINTSTMHFCFDILGMHYIASQIVATAVTLLWHFIVNSLWSFRQIEVDK